MSVLFCNRSIAIGAVALLAFGCASTKPEETALERVGDARGALDDTGAKLERAESELSKVHETLSELQSQFEKAGDPFSREQAGSSLGRLSLQVEQTRMDMREMHSRNRERAAELDARLKGFAESSQVDSLRTEQPKPPKAKPQE